ncbi:tetraspanin-33 [Pungitius pungitius]|uniref:tetraspanin-33 n=1 Tax=Pungitius pungitius TaxID=134920 RepID=UPI002E0D1DB1
MRGYRAIKYTLFICCHVFWVVSAVLAAVGIYAKIAKEKDVVDTLMLDPALLLIVVGSAMFLITFLGCFGALRNATCLLKTFLGILTAILLLQIAAGVVGYLFTDTVMERTEMLMMKAIVRYREDQDLENAIDFIQKKFQCCGVESYKDWSRNVYFECTETNPSLEACGVPFSCCINLQNQTVVNTMCGYGMQPLQEKAAGLNVFTMGCLEKIVWWAKHNLLLVAGLTGGLLLLEVCMICLAAAQISRIKKVHQLKNAKATRSRLERKDSSWYPAFADFDESDHGDGEK